MSDEWGDDTIVRIAHRRRFTRVANEPIEDERLSWAALGIFVWLLSKPDNWRIDGRSIAKLSRGLGRDRVFAALSELRDAEYLQLVTYRDEHGLMRSVNVLYECPQCEDEGPGPTESWHSGPGDAADSAKALVAPDPDLPDPGPPDPGQPGPGGQDPLQRRRPTTKNARDATTPRRSDPADEGASKGVIADTERQWDGSRFVAIRDGVVVPLPQLGPDLSAVITAACGYDTARMTGRARREISEASRELRDLGADEADVRRVAKVMRQQWGEGALTPPSLVRHWPRFVAQRDPEATFVQQPHRVVPGVRFVDGRLVEDPTVTGEVEP